MDGFVWMMDWTDGINLRILCDGFEERYWRLRTFGSVLIASLMDANLFPSVATLCLRLLLFLVLFNLYIAICIGLSRFSTYFVFLSSLGGLAATWITNREGHFSSHCWCIWIPSGRSNMTQRRSFWTPILRPDFSLGPGWLVYCLDCRCWLIDSLTELSFERVCLFSCGLVWDFSCLGWRILLISRLNCWAAFWLRATSSSSFEIFCLSSSFDVGFHLWRCACVYTLMLELQP